MTATRSSGRGAESELGTVDLTLLVRTLLRRWLTIAVALALFLGAATAYLMTATPIYRATSRVVVDPRDKEVVGDGLVRPLLGTDKAWIETQADLVKTTFILNTVIADFGLQDDAEFAGKSPAETLKNLSEATLVERPEETYVLDVHVKSKSAEMAANLSRAIADGYVRSLSEAKATALRQANDLLAGQLEDLRSQAREADEALQTYRRENGIVVADGRLVDEDRLKRLNDAYVDARLNAEAARVRRDALDAAAKAGIARIDSAVDAANSAVLSRLKIELAMAEKSLADLDQQLGPSHPRRLSAAAEAQRAKSQVMDEIRSLAASADADYEAAASREESTRVAVESATVAVNEAGAAGVRMRQLENEANARTELYRAFLKRVEETARQENTQISDARVIAPAEIPMKPYSPKRTLVLALAAIAGLGVGFSAAIYRGRRDLLDGAGTEPDAPVGEAPSTAVTTRFEDVEVAQPVAPPPPRVALAEMPVRIAQAPRTVRQPVPDIRLHGRVVVDTRPTRPSRIGRPIAVSPQAMLASSVETVDGRVDDAAMRMLAHAVGAEGHAGGRLVVVKGFTTPRATAAVTYGLARSAAAHGPTLLVDASATDGEIAAAFLKDGAPSLLDVLAGQESTRRLQELQEDKGLTVAPLFARGGPPSARGVGAAARFLADLAADFHVTVVDVGADPDRAFFDALSSRADEVIAVVDADRLDSEENNASIRLAVAVSGCDGLIAVDDRGRSLSVVA